MIYEFSPKQDLHGYSKPWAPGDGSNIWNEEWVAGIINGETGATESNLKNIRSADFIPVTPNTVYYISTPTSQTVIIWGYSSEKEPIKRLKYSAGNATFNTNNDGDDIVYIMFSTAENYGNTYKNNISINYPSTITSYSPYANICPPEGYNIWDPGQDKMVQVYSGYVDAEARKLYLHPVYAEYDGEELVGPWMSSMDEYTEEGTPTTGAFVVDMGGEVTEYDITDFMLQTLLDSLGIRRFIASGAMLLNSLMDQAQGRVRSEAELLNRSLPIHVIAIGKELPTNLVIKKPVSDVLPVLPGKTKI